MFLQCRADGVTLSSVSVRYVYEMSDFVFLVLVIEDVQLRIKEDSLCFSIG